MSSEDIFINEKRNNSNIFDIHLYLEGSFWRAYEWSAYLSRIFPSELKEEERLNPTKKASKHNEDGKVQVGLPQTSFDKYFPGILMTDNNQQVEIEDKHIIIHAKEFFNDVNIFKNSGNYEVILKDWKSKIKFSEKEKKLNEQFSEKSVKIDKNFEISILEEITSYPMERHSLLEIVEFFSKIREKSFIILKKGGS